MAGPVMSTLVIYFGVTMYGSQICSFGTSNSIIYTRTQFHIHSLVRHEVETQGGWLEDPCRVEGGLYKDMHWMYMYTVCATIP